jgi:hypothetical protein
MVCCANKINAISFTLCKLKREVEKLSLSLGPWSQWYSVYLSLLHAQRCVPSFLSCAVIATKDKCLVAGQEYLEVEYKGCTLYVFTNLSLTCGPCPGGEGIVYVSAKALAKVVELAPGGSMKVTGELCCKDCVICGCLEGSLEKGLKEGSLSVEEVVEILENREKKEEHHEEEECEPFESSEPFETVDFTTTTDVDGQNIQEVEKRLRQILDVTETNTEVTEQ